MEAAVGPREGGVGGFGGSHNHTEISRMKGCGERGQGGCQAGWLTCAEGLSQGARRGKVECEEYERQRKAAQGKQRLWMGVVTERRRGWFCCAVTLRRI